MTDSDRDSLDRETRAAVDALVSRYRAKGDADDEPWAEEFIAWLKVRGWRPTLAVPAPDWKAPREDRGGDYARGAELWRTALAERATGPQPALTDTGEIEQLREGADP